MLSVEVGVRDGSGTLVVELFKFAARDVAGGATVCLERADAFAARHGLVDAQMNSSALCDEADASGFTLRLSDSAVDLVRSIDDGLDGGLGDRLGRRSTQALDVLDLEADVSEEAAHVVIADRRVRRDHQGRVGAQRPQRHAAWRVVQQL